MQVSPPPLAYYRHNKFNSKLVLPLAPKSLPPKNEKPPTAKKLPPYCFTAEKIPHILVYRFRQSRYRQKRETRQTPKITAVWRSSPRTLAAATSNLPLGCRLRELKCEGDNIHAVHASSTSEPNWRRCGARVPTPSSELACPRFTALPPQSDPSRAEVP